MNKEKKARFVPDMIGGPILQNLIMFAVPIFISNVFQQLYNTMDTAIVGNTLGTESLAAIGSVNSVFDLLTGFCIGIGSGMAIVTGRCYGAKDPDRIKQSVAGCIVIGVVSCILFTILAALGVRPLLHLINVPEHLIEKSYSYIIVIILGLVVMFAYNTLAGVMRAIGNSVIPLIFLVFSSVLNVILDLVLITQAHMGVAGAAVATVIAQGVSAVLCVIYIMKKTPLLIPERRHFAIDAKMYKDLLGQGYSMAMMGAIVNAGSVILQSGINGLGSTLIAAHTAARKLYMFFFMPILSLGIAMATFIAQNAGAKKPERIIKGMQTAYTMDVVLAAVISVVLFFFADAIVSLIAGTTEPDVVKNGGLYLKVVGPNYAVLGILLNTRYGLQGIGKKLLPLISSVIEFAMKILFVIAFIPMFGFYAVVACEPVIWVVMTIQLLFSFWGSDYIRAARHGNAMDV
ncbi:MAG: MATE family efflux transporter [Lachnospiraceae bacterium]|nr:MATE family efflux transporter [Lachnospiraceae bacterium]